MGSFSEWSPYDKHVVPGGLIWAGGNRSKGGKKGMMNLSDFVAVRKNDYDSFRRWMEKRVGPSVVMSEEGWESTFLLWKVMIKNNVPEPMMDRVLQSVGGGWYRPLGGL
jgi:hypothetical protein